jgi:hypothetical protein
VQKTRVDPSFLPFYQRNSPINWILLVVLKNNEKIFQLSTFILTNSSKNRNKAISSKELQRMSKAPPHGHVGAFVVIVNNRKQ